MTTMSKAYVIADIEVTDPEAYGRYRELSGPAVAAYGGRFLIRGGRTEVLEGDWQPHRVVVLEFDDEPSAQAFYHSPEYAEAIKIRQSAATSSFILVEGA